MNGKITITPRQERMGRRLRARPRSAVWFAREPPWRHGRSALRYRGLKCAPLGAKLGGTAEKIRPMCNLLHVGFLLYQSVDRQGIPGLYGGACQAGTR